MRKLNALIAFFIVLPGIADAYVGPGLGLGAIAIIAGVLLSVLIALFAIVWYPIKRRIKAKRQRDAEESGTRQ